MLYKHPSHPGRHPGPYTTGNRPMQHAGRHSATYHCRARLSSTINFRLYLYTLLEANHTLLCDLEKYLCVDTNDDN